MALQTWMARRLKRLRIKQPRLQPSAQIGLVTDRVRVISQANQAGPLPIDDVTFLSVFTTLKTIRTRMPVILRSEDHDAQLNGTPAEARAVLKSVPGGSHGPNGAPVWTRSATRLSWRQTNRPYFSHGFHTDERVST